MSYSITHLAVGLPTAMSYEDGKNMNTAICKQMIESVSLKKEGFVGDGVADLKHHGGAERAVCFYPFEHYTHWNQQFQTDLPKAAFGENLLVEGMLESEVCIGDVYQIGETTVAITQGRVPCITIDRRTGATGLFKQIMHTGFTGYFAKVLEEGIIKKDSSIHLVSRSSHHISVLTANQLFFQQRKETNLLEQLLQEKHLADKWYAHFQRLMGRTKS